MKIGIMSAMPEENLFMKEKMQITSTHDSAGRIYSSGKFMGKDVVLAFSRWGKIASAITALELIITHKIDLLIFTGVAGAVQCDLKAGDIIVAKDLVQHDMDAQPLYPRFEIPLIKKSFFDVDADLFEKTLQAAQAFKQNYHMFVESDLMEKFKLDKPEIYSGTIASGDKFFNSHDQILELRSQIPGALCVEMEGASIAQVCYEHGVPFSVIRTISDAGDETAFHDFASFVRHVASPYSLGILSHLIPLI
jgi:adenosylhomocysteine nucleosidase